MCVARGACMLIEPERQTEAQACERLDNPAKGFTLLFSIQPFPGFELELDWVRPELGGNWYVSNALGMEGWLCPALFKYFESAPAKIYAQFKNAKRS